MIANLSLDDNLDLFNQIINVIICENTPNELVTSFLIMTNGNQEGAPLKSVLIETIMDSLRNKNNFSFESEKKMNSFNFANDVDALKLIFNSTHTTINDLLSNEEQLKFFKEKFIADMDVQFTKKLYLNDSKDKEEDFHPIYNEDENIQFSLETLREMIDFKLSIYDKYLKGEDYQKALDEHEEMLQKKEQDENDDNRSEKLSNDADGSAGRQRHSLCRAAGIRGRLRYAYRNAGALERIGSCGEFDSRRRTAAGTLFGRG